MTSRQRTVVPTFMGTIRHLHPLRLVLLAICLSIGSTATAQISDYGESVDLVCPCTVSAVNPSSVDVSFGLRNFEYSAHGPYVVSVMATVGEFAMNLGHIALPNILPPDSEVPISQYSTPLFVEIGLPKIDEVFLALRQVVNGQPGPIIDWVFAEAGIPINSHGGVAFAGTFIDGTASASVTGLSVSLDLPPIVNSGLTGDVSDLAVSVYETDTPRIWRGQSVNDRTGFHRFNVPLPSGQTMDSQTIAVPLSSRDEGKYLHVAVVDRITTEILSFQTVVAPVGATLPHRSFNLENIDFLVDSDNDGVSDRNEDIAGTDPHDSTSAPGPSELDISVAYSPQVTDHYGGDPRGRIHHIMSVANAMFQFSDTGISLRLVNLVETPVDESNPFGTLDFDATKIQNVDIGADLTVLLRKPDQLQGLCGFAILNGYTRSGGTRGWLDYDLAQIVATVMVDCGALTVAHEIGHVLGLGHSFRQDETGTYRWARGHGVDDTFATIMAYPFFFGSAPHMGVFSDPDDHSCVGFACGVHDHQYDGADSVKALQAVRFQVAEYVPPPPDTDGDGFVDGIDEFPDDASEWVDSDLDGIGDNADPDDDNDGYLDVVDAFPFDPTEWLDTDGDQIGNNADPDDDNDSFLDFEDAFPLDPTEWADTDLDGIGDNADPDRDGDGFDNEVDVFPLDPFEWADVDTDGIGDNSDMFPDDPWEWADVDGDGIGDNTDDDWDNDGVPNIHDAAPFDPLRHTLGSYRLMADRPGDLAGYSVASADLDGDGHPDLLVGATGATHVLAGSDMAAADESDGVTDRVVQLARVASQENSWKLVSENTGGLLTHTVGTPIDLNGDGTHELLIAVPEANHGNGAVYAVSMSDLPAADRMDGAEDSVVSLSAAVGQPHSWVFEGKDGEGAGGYVHAVGVGMDGNPAVLISSARHVYEDASGASAQSGAAYVTSAADFANADMSDGSSDGVIQLANISAQSASWMIRGTSNTPHGGAVAAGDINGDGNIEFMFGDPIFDFFGVGAVYIVAAQDVTSADSADGTEDGIVDVSNIAQQANSWQLVGEILDERAGMQLAVADYHGDAVADLLIGGFRSMHLVAHSDLESADSQDGSADGVVLLRNLDGSLHSRALVHTDSVAGPQSMAYLGDLDADGVPELMYDGTPYTRFGREETGTVIFSLADVDLLDSLDGAKDGIAQFATLDHFPGGIGIRVGHHLRGVGGDGAGFSVASVADMDGDLLPEILVGAPRDRYDAGAAYLVMSTDLPVLEALGSEADNWRREALLGDVAGDDDQDGIENAADRDDDNDGYPDVGDDFPLDSLEHVDSDGDGVGDASDVFPRNPLAQRDTDMDGIPDSFDSDADGDGIEDSNETLTFDTDNDGITNDLDNDDDGDGVVDAEDRFPVDASEWSDTDFDGIGNNADNDDDNDGVEDSLDAFPLDPTETVDSDGDGVGDVADVFPNDASEWLDWDSDGIGDNADTDDDGDGVEDSMDAFPYDPTETADSDLDGVGDHADAFPNDASETHDTDGDGRGDNADNDDDGDGVRDADDLFPLLAAKSDLTSRRLLAEAAHRLHSCAYALGDVNGDGVSELGITLHRDTGEFPSNPRTYLISGSAFTDMESDDNTINLVDVADLTDSWEIVSGMQYASVSGCPMLLSPSEQYEPMLVVSDFGRGDAHGYYFVGVSQIGALDSADGDADGRIYLPGALESNHESVLHISGPGVSLFAGAPSVAFGDVEGDGQIDVTLGFGGVGEAGFVDGPVSIFPLSRLGDVDLVDGISDGRATSPALGVGWTIYDSRFQDLTGATVAMGDIDGDGLDDVAIGAPFSSTGGPLSGHVFLVSATALAAVSSDRAISPIDLYAWPGNTTIFGQGFFLLAGNVSLGDTDLDGLDDIVIAAPSGSPTTRSGSSIRNGGIVYVINALDLEPLDQADFFGPGAAVLDNVAAQPRSWQINGASFQSIRGAAADFDSDGVVDIVISSGHDRAYLLSGKDLSHVDAADGWPDGVISVTHIANGPNSWEWRGSVGTALASVDPGADVDGDGHADIMVSTRTDTRWQNYLQPVATTLFVSGTDLPVLDRADGVEDRIVHLSEIFESSE